MSEQKAHARALEPTTLGLSLVVSVLSAIICMQIISKIGITPNTSIVGAIIAMTLARIPFAHMDSFRSLERQNLVQTMTSGAGFAAANCGLLAVGIIYVFGTHEYIIPMLIGSGVATLIGMHFVYRVYDSDIFPATGAWPPGVATAKALIAGDEGGEKAKRLLQGVAVGAVGSHFGLPMAGIGIVFIANIFAMTALGVGLVIRGYSGELFGLELGETYIPHGVMIGAGLVSLIQALMIIFRGKRLEIPTTESGEPHEPTVTPNKAKRAIGIHVVLFAFGAVALALVSGFWTEMTVGKLAIWVLWATFSAIVAPILVGLSAMHSGWFPGFAITIIFLSLGLFMGFPGVPLALLAGYVASTGPCFADMGYDLKTGFIIRGEGKNTAYEIDGRRQQMISELIGGFVAMATVFFLMNMHFRLDLLAPVSRVFAATVEAGAHPDILRQLLMWSVAGGVLQFFGGASRAVGILFATGLLIKNPIYGIGVLAAVIARMIWGTKWMEMREAGLIAGDGLYGFFSAVIRSFL
ncbi:MAG: OPT/YSL family transporter [Thermovirgaceae bacterium]